MRDNFRIGLRNKLVALAAQHLAQRLVVLDDAVVYQRERVVREDRVRVVGYGRAMRRPTSVGDARDAFQMTLAHLLVEIGHACDAARTARLAIGKHGHAA